MIEVVVDGSGVRDFDDGEMGEERVNVVISGL